MLYHDVSVLFAGRDWVGSQEHRRANLQVSPAIGMWELGLNGESGMLPKRFAQKVLVKTNEGPDLEKS